MTEQRRFSAKETAALVLVYAVAALLAFGAVLRSGFVGDDWLFLGFAVPADSIGVCFAPLAGRFIRPLVMLTYFLNHRLFGLSPLPYHLTLVGIHILASCLVALVAARLTGSKWVAFWSGLLFATFAGHAEAVGWVAGAADPWLAVFLLAGLLLFAKGLESERAMLLLGLSFLALVVAYLAKESAVVGVALVTGWGVIAAWLGDRSKARRTLMRTAAVAVALVVTAATYLWMRSFVFGSAIGSYNDLNADRSILGQQLIAFAIRSFFPPTHFFGWASLRWLAVTMILAAAVIIAIKTRGEARQRGGFLFLCAAYCIVLAPVLPLTISLGGTTSERYVYVPTLFSCILTAWAVSLVCGGRRVVAGLVLSGLIVAQQPALARANAERLAAAAVFRDFMTEAVSLLRSEAPAGGNSRVFFLTIPDSLGGVMVARSAFHPALSVLAPEIKDGEWRAAFVASHALDNVHDQTAVWQDDRNRFRVGLGGGRFVESTLSGNADYEITALSPTGYAIQFAPSRWRRILVYQNDGHLQRVGSVEAGVLDATPFGTVDMPPVDPACSADTLRFSGWAVDDSRGMEVIAQHETTPGMWTDVGQATRVAGTRPDVEKLFTAYPEVERAEWNYWLACSTGAPGRRLHVRIIARDSAAQEANLGERFVGFAGRR